jgi:hypothetical protein
MTYYPWMDDSRAREKGRGAICESTGSYFSLVLLGRGVEGATSETWGWNPILNHLGQKDHHPSPSHTQKRWPSSVYVCSLAYGKTMLIRSDLDPQHCLVPMFTTVHYIVLEDFNCTWDIGHPVVYLPCGPSIWGIPRVFLSCIVLDRAF